MWKRLDESISLSEKWSGLTWPAMGIGIYILANSDSKGRYLADPRIIKARCMTFRYDLRLELVEDALNELERERVLHRYDAEGKKYLVIHDHDVWNPPGALKNTAPKYPSPDPNVCECQRRDSGAIAPPVMSPSLSSSSSQELAGTDSIPDAPETNAEYGGGDLPPSELQRIFKGAVKQAQTTPAPTPQDGVIQHLLRLVPAIKSTSALKVWRQIIEGTRVRFGAQAVEAWMMDPGNRGKSAFDMEKELVVLHKGNDLGAKVKLKAHNERRFDARRQVADKMLAFLKDHAPTCSGCRDCDRDRIGLRELGIPEAKIPKAKPKEGKHERSEVG